MKLNQVKLKTKQKVIYKDLFYILQYINNELHIVNENQDLYYDYIGLDYSYEFKDIIDDILVYNKENINNTKKARIDKLKTIKEKTKEAIIEHKRIIKENKKREDKAIKDFIKQTKKGFGKPIDPEKLRQLEVNRMKDEAKEMLERVVRLIKII